MHFFKLMSTLLPCEPEEQSVDQPQTLYEVRYCPVNRLNDSGHASRLIRVTLRSLGPYQTYLNFAEMKLIDGKYYTIGLSFNVPISLYRKLIQISRQADFWMRTHDEKLNNDITFRWRHGTATLKYARGHTKCIRLSFDTFKDLCSEKTFIDFRREAYWSDFWCEELWDGDYAASSDDE